MSMNHIDRLTDDILVEIFSRLPVKSLLQAKCISKSCHALLSDDIHKKKLPQAMSGIFYRHSSNKIDYISICHKINPIIDTCGLGFLPSHVNRKILGHSNGLLLGQYQQEGGSSAYFVSNPATKKFDTITASGNRSDLSALAFDPRVSPHYKLISIEFESQPNRVDSIEIFSSESGIWTRSDKFGGVEAVWMPRGDSVFLDGIVYLSVLYQAAVMAVDVERKIVRRMELPRYGVSITRDMCLGRSAGRLCYALKTDDRMRSDTMIVWVLEDLGGNEWIVKRKISLMDLADESKVLLRPYFCSDVKILAFHPDVDVVFLKVDEKLFSYHLNTSRFTEISSLMGGGLHGALYYPRGFYPYSPCYSSGL